VSFVEEYRRTTNYVDTVLTAGLEDVRRALASIDDAVIYRYRASLARAYRALRALCDVLVPSLRPPECSELRDGGLRKLLDSGPQDLVEAERRLETVLDRVLEELDKRGVLVPKRMLEVGSFADSLEEDTERL